MTLNIERTEISSISNKPKEYKESALVPQQVAVRKSPDASSIHSPHVHCAFPRTNSDPSQAVLNRYAWPRRSKRVLIFTFTERDQRTQEGSLTPIQELWLIYRENFRHNMTPRFRMSTSKTMSTLALPLRAPPSHLSLWNMLRSVLLCRASTDLFISWRPSPHPNPRH